jgi:hypothetical protein
MTANDCLWLRETTRGTYETINAAVMNKFGVEPPDNSFILTFPFNRQINTVSNLASRTATFTAGPSYTTDIKVNTIPVNGILEYDMLGDSSSADGVHTITSPAVTVAKPSLTVYRQGQAATEKWKGAGLVAKSLTNYFKPGQPESAMVMYDGMTDAVTTDTPNTSPIFPTNIASAFDVQSTFTINAASYTKEETSWSYNQAIAGYGNNAGKFRGIVDTQPVIVTGTFNIVGDVTALRTIWAAGTGVTVVDKLLKSVDTAKYKQRTVTMNIMSMSDNFRLDDGTDRCVVTMIGSNPSVAVKDGVADAFYGD